jgi:hypothetical protein
METGGDPEPAAAQHAAFYGLWPRFPDALEGATAPSGEEPSQEN